MRYVIAYDIVEDDVRTQVANYLIAQGMMRIQYSVYEGELKRSELKSIKLMLEEMTINSVSTVHFFSQCSKCVERKQTISVMAEGTDQEPTEEIGSEESDTEESDKSPTESTETETTKESEQSKIDPKISALVFSKQTVLTLDTLSEFFIENTYQIQTTLIRKTQKKKRRAKGKAIIQDLSLGTLII